MKLMHRLGADLIDAYIDGYLSAAKKHPAACDNVWLATKYGYPPKTAHEELAAYHEKVARRFRDAGISVSLQLSNTFGHGEYMSSRDCSGLVFEGSPARRMVGHDGTVAGYCFCWRGRFFRDYINQTLIPYLEKVKPDVVWVDDDLRVSNHAPVAFGCFCDDCVGAFNEEHGTAFTRETLVREILHGELDIRKKYIAFLRRNIYNFVYELGSTIHKICPDAAMGYQYYCNGAYSGYGYDFIFDAMRDATGHAPMSRPGGGAYDDHNPNEFLLKALETDWQNAMLPDYVKVRCPEIESLPFVALGKSGAGTAFETSCYFANGNTDMSYSMAMRFKEPVDFYAETMRLFAQNRPYWDRLTAVNEESHGAGLQFFMSKNIWAKKLPDGADMKTLNAENALVITPFLHTGIPFTYDKGEERLFLLHPESAQHLSDAEIEYLLSHAVVTDGETVELLARRGCRLGATAKRVPAPDAGKLTEILFEHPSNKGALEEWTSSFFVAGKTEAYCFTDLEKGTEPIAKYGASLPIPALTSDSDAPYGYASVIFETGRGGRWAALGYVPWKGIISHARREQFLNVADYVSSGRLAARLLSPLQASVLPRSDKDGNTLCVSVINCTVGESGPLSLHIRAPKVERFTFMAQRGVCAECEWEKTDDGYLVTTPSLAAWTVGTVFCEK